MATVQMDLLVSNDQLIHNRIKIVNLIISDDNGCFGSECYDPMASGEYKSPDPEKLCNGRSSKCYRYCTTSSGTTGVQYKCC